MLNCHEDVHTPSTDPDFKREIPMGLRPSTKKSVSKTSEVIGINSLSSREICVLAWWVINFYVA